MRRRPLSNAMLVALFPAWLVANPPARDYPLTPVPFTAVKVRDGFWTPRLETNRTVTVRYDFQKCEETGRISNFARAGGLAPGGFEGIFFNDSDVFKVVEGAAYALSLHPDEALEEYVDGVIEKIAAAQEDDGYLYTARTLRPDDPPQGSGKSRWSHLAHSHELYNVGHMYEAAVAYFQATGKRKLLDVALRNAALIDRVFGPEKKRDVPGHQEIEIGLVRLYRATGDEKYLKLARFFLDERGRPSGRALYGPYSQDHAPVTEQEEAVGHAVRAGYMYSAMTDIAALTGDEAYARALDRIWDDVVSRKMYITGGIGSRASGEAFGDAYELPNATAYNETCAAIANALWNHRMFLLHGDAKYIDVVERVIYNGFLSGVSFSGDRFFYPNPLACSGLRNFNQGAATRQPWFGCSCCPVNVVRFIPSIAGYICATREQAVHVNLFIGGVSKVRLRGTSVRLTQKTTYPWSGTVTIRVDPERADDFALHLRVPGWARGEPVPGDLYRYMDATAADFALEVNGRPVTAPLEKGFAVIRRRWSPGDEVELRLPMPVRRVLAHEKVAANVGRVALERGPLVYCFEGVDNRGKVRHLVLPDEAELRAEHRPGLLGGVTVITGVALATRRGADGTPSAAPVRCTAIPYYAWSHRGVGEMAVWTARETSRAEPLKAPTVASTSRASASHCWHLDSAQAMNDQLEPASSKDHGLPRFTWWDHRGSEEWVQYDFDRPREVSEVDVYWFDDTGVGQCRLPRSWRLLYRHGDEWRAVAAAGEYGVRRDAFNTVRFEPVTTTALRVEVMLQPNYSGGILEWRVR